MYIFPGYITHDETDGAIYVSSKLLENKVELSDPTIQEEFRSLIKAGGCPELTTPLTQFLHEQELLLSEAEIKSTLEKVKALLNNTLILTIMPTEGCNFRCPYCYEDHEIATMTRATLDRIQEYIAEQAPPVPVCSHQLVRRRADPLRGRDPGDQPSCPGPPERAWLSVFLQHDH